MLEILIALLLLPITIVLGLVAGTVALIYLYFWQIVGMVVFWGAIFFVFSLLGEMLE